MLSTLMEAGRRLGSGGRDSGGFTFEDDFRRYENNHDLKSVWASNSQIFLCRDDGNGAQSLRCWIPEDFWGNVCVWSELPSAADLMGKTITVRFRRATRMLMGAAHLYIEQGGRHYRSLAACVLKNGPLRRTLTLLNAAPKHFVGFADKGWRPNLASVDKIGVCISAAASRDGGSVDYDLFAVTTLPAWLLNFGTQTLPAAASAFKSRPREGTAVPV